VKGPFSFMLLSNTAGDGSKASGGDFGGIAGRGLEFIYPS
jgi:hypothetical protein